MFIICFDLEGVFTPEVWINVAKETEIDELKLTTRDISDYDALMKQRLKILKEHGITLKNIQDIISKMELLPGAREFLDWIRTITQVLILSDTFIEFGMPFMKKLGYPTLLCHDLEVDEKGMISNYRLRIRDMKRQTVIALKKMNYDVIAIGDSYNDTGMLSEAKHGILFRPPESVIKEFPQFPVVTGYSDLKNLISKYLET
ncbi:MAG: bifunctional phosphoserine phosphatase/homoserine phosphotransferase ThrH [Candidatus Helarchaeota archaeon]